MFELELFITAHRSVLASPDADQAVSEVEHKQSLRRPPEEVIRSEVIKWDFYFEK